MNSPHPSPIEHLLSTLYYTEHFHWLSDFDQLSYTLVTFRAAVEYLRGPEVLKWLPPRRPQQTKSQVMIQRSLFLYKVIDSCWVCRVPRQISLSWLSAMLADMGAPPQAIPSPLVRRALAVGVATSPVSPRASCHNFA